MIDKDAKPIRNDPPYKRIDDRPRVITREQVEDNVHREPDLALYNFDGNTYTLKD
jgi:hypothetical protein